MISKMPLTAKAIDYEAEAQAYLNSLPLEHFMEATPQAKQRAITLASLALVVGRRRDVHVFNELLVQYPLRGHRKVRQVVPDNMVVLATQAIGAMLSYNVPEEPAEPFWMLEYVSESNPRRDYKRSRRKYERELKVPYYLVFRPAKQKLTLYHHNGQRYVKVKPNDSSRYEIAEMELEVALVDGWVRYWHQGKLLPLPVELQKQLDDALLRAEEATRRADDLQRRLEEAEREHAKVKPRNGSPPKPPPVSN